MIANVNLAMEGDAVKARMTAQVPALVYHGESIEKIRASGEARMKAAR